MLTLKVCLHRAQCTIAQLAADLCISSSSQVHASIRRSRAAGLLDKDALAARPGPVYEFTVHGVKYAFPAVLGPVARGVPTAHSGPGFREEFGRSDPLVWPHPDGKKRGVSVSPLHGSVPDAALTDPALHKAQAAVDCFRVGMARERKFAAQVLEELLLGGDRRRK